MRRAWLKKVSAAVTLLLLILALCIVWLITTQSGLRWTYQQAMTYLPSEVTIDKLEGRLIGPITIRGIEVQQQGTLVKVEKATLDWQPLALLTANIDISHLHVQSLEITLPETEKSDEPVTLPEINLPWSLALEDVVVSNVRVNQPGQSVELKQIKLNASTLLSQITIKSFDLAMNAFELNVKGKLNPARNYNHQLDVRWRTELPSRAVLEGNGRIKGNIEALNIQQQVSGPLQLTLKAEVREPLKQLNWQANVTVSDFSTTRLDASWPGISGKLQLQAQGELNTATLAGNMEGNYVGQGPFDAHFNLRRLQDNSIQINQLALHSPVSNTQLDLHGKWLPDDNGGKATLELDWQNLRWPLQNATWFESASGKGKIEGNTNGLHINTIKFTTLDGEVIANGQLNWSPRLTWQLDIKASEINPGKQWPEWPGLLKAKLTSTGRSENDQLIVDVDINQLSGKLRDYPVTLNSRLNWHNNDINISLFDFRSGTSKIIAHGRIGSTLNLDWSITAPNLGELYPQAQGELRASGVLSGPQATPTINATLQGKALSLPNYKIGAIEGKIGVDLFSWQQVDIKLVAESLNLNNYKLKMLDVNADTEYSQIKVVADEATTLIELKGKASPQGWRGQLVKTDIQSQRFNDWHLRAPANISFKKNTVSLEKLCLQNQVSSLCAALQREDETWQSSLTMNKLPLELISPWLPADLKFEGVTDATAELKFHGPDQLLGQLSVKLLPGTVSYPLLEGERDRWQYRGGTIAATLDQQGLKASSDIAMSNGDRFQGQLTLPDVKLIAMDSTKQSLQASAQLKIHDLGLIEALIPEVQDLKGEVELSLTATGTVAEPRLSGHANLLKGALRIPRLGLNIDQLSLKSQSTGLEKLEFRLDAHSGDGNLTVEGQTLMNINAGWPSSITVKGDAFEVSSIPEARVNISPNLQVKVEQRTINITGEVHIPYAKLQPKDITTAARVSDDAVIIGGEQRIEDKWTALTRVRLTLGERVNFYGFGFEGRFGGNLLIEDEPGQPTRATGEINVPEGRYAAYGQRLEVEHGRLLYTGGPVTNPGLDLRAVRKVNNVTAGLKVRGSLNQPDVELFSIPTMGQTDTLSYLLLGRPMETASGEEGAMMAKAALALSLSGGDHLARSLGDRFGLDEMRIESNESGDQASLVVGRYLSPKLYISYGVGLIEAANTLNLRYQISDKWQLKGESGEHQGADFLYSIER